jgi:hypothetical protein
VILPAARCVCVCVCVCLCVFVCVCTIAAARLLHTMCIYGSMVENQCVVVSIVVNEYAAVACSSIVM